MRRRAAGSVAAVVLSIAACDGQIVDVGSLDAPDSAALSGSGTVRDSGGAGTAGSVNRLRGPSPRMARTFTGSRRTG